MINACNYGTVIGRLARDPQIFTNEDGSRKVLMTVMVRRNFKQNGTYQSDAVSLEAYLPKEFNAPIYNMIHQGDQVAIMYTVRSSSYQKGGETIWAEAKQIETIQLLESKTTTDARLAARKAEAAPAPVEAAPVAVDMDAVQMPAIG